MSAPHPKNIGLRTSPEGVALVAKWEGYRAKWYKDPVGVLTIGYGWTRPLPPGFHPPLSEVKARQLLREGLKDYEDGVRRYVRVPINQNEFDALVSFTYNVGVGALKRSTLLRRLNADDRETAAAEFLRWNKAGGTVLPGLTRRRAEEAKLFRSVVPGLAIDVEPDPDTRPVAEAKPRPPEPLRDSQTANDVVDMGTFSVAIPHEPDNFTRSPLEWLTQAKKGLRGMFG